MQCIIVIQWPGRRYSIYHHHLGGVRAHTHYRIYLLILVVLTFPFVEKIKLGLFCISLYLIQDFQLHHPHRSDHIIFSR